MRRSFVLWLAAVLVVVATACRPRQTGPNDAYLDPRVSADDWNLLFTAHGRELYDERDLIMQLAAVRPGMSVADVGAGTGAFTLMLSDAVGPTGRVYAEEVVGKFSRFIAETAADGGRFNVVSVVGTERTVGLAPGSIDLAFLCDVYHHFDHPEEMLASIRRALRPEGEVLLIEFRREPGAAPWVFEHVRAGEDEVLHEFERAGFARLQRSGALQGSYMWRFRLASTADSAAGPSVPAARLSGPRLAL
jgi:ubiquinone/menaquinone biosynthesis C-methylase UbiE